jgi:hypothetical protein
LFKIFYSDQVILLPDPAHHGATDSTDEVILLFDSAVRDEPAEDSSDDVLLLPDPAPGEPVLPVAVESRRERNALLRQRRPSEPAVASSDDVILLPDPAPREAVRPAPVPVESRRERNARILALLRQGRPSEPDYIFTVNVLFLILFLNLIYK